MVSQCPSGCYVAGSSHLLLTEEGEQSLVTGGKQNTRPAAGFCVRSSESAAVCTAVSPLKLVLEREQRSSHKALMRFEDFLVIANKINATAADTSISPERLSKTSGHEAWTLRRKPSHWKQTHWEQPSRCVHVLQRTCLQQVTVQWGVWKIVSMSSSL